MESISKEESQQIPKESKPGFLSRWFRKIDKALEEKAKKECGCKKNTGKGTGCCG